MTNNMREALQDAAKHAIRRVHDCPGQPGWPFPHNTLRALLRHGYVEYTELISRKGHRVQQWAITELGRQALKAPGWVAEEKPVFMAWGYGDTSDRSRALDDVEKMGAPSWKWRRQSALERIGAQEPRQAASRVARSLRVA